MKLSFTKMQGCANDYIYLDCRKSGVPENIAALSEKLSRRHFSIGADGIICICAAQTAGADGMMRIFNADGSEAQMCGNGVRCVAEVSNMGCTPEAIAEFQKAGILFAPGKAVNAGGVATSGLEMTQNAQHLSWSAEEVDKKLHYIMSQIHEACVTYGTQPDGYINYVKGANVAGFMKVAHAMLEQGII